MIDGDFVTRFSHEKRQQEADRIINKYPGRLPVICEISKNNIKEFDLDKGKYLVPKDLTVGQFVYVIRKRLKISAEKAIFLFSNNILPPTSLLMEILYDQHKNTDGFLYIVVSSENTFGS